MSFKRALVAALVAATLSTLVVAEAPAWETPTKDNFALFQLENPARALAIAQEATPNDKHVFTWLQCHELRVKYPKPVQ